MEMKDVGFLVECKFFFHPPTDLGGNEWQEDLIYKVGGTEVKTPWSGDN